MSKKTAELAGTSLINTKVLDTLGVKKQRVSKTIFRLPPEWEDFLRHLAKSSKQTIREFLDSLATIAKQAHSDGVLPVLDTPVDGRRMSYAISHEAKETFSALAKECKTSRDNIIYRTLAFIAKEFEKKALTPQEKIEYARILEDAQKSMLEIYWSESVSEARDKLCGCGDPEFAECDEKLSYIGQLNELDIEGYIRRKQDEINKACS